MTVHRREVGKAVRVSITLNRPESRQQPSYRENRARWEIAMLRMYGYIPSAEEQERAYLAVVGAATRGD